MREKSELQGLKYKSKEGSVKCDNLNISISHLEDE